MISVFTSFPRSIAPPPDPPLSTIREVYFCIANCRSFILLFFFLQKPQNVIETATGVHSKKPWFRGKTPAVVSAIGNRFNFGYQSPPKVASSRPNNGLNSTAHSERGSTEVKRIGERGKDLV